MSDIEELRARLESVEAEQTLLRETFRQVDGDAHEAKVLALKNVKLMEQLRITQLEQGEQLQGLQSDVAELKAGVGLIQELLGRLVEDRPGEDTSA